jgi:hypothetical protein
MRVTVRDLAGRVFTLEADERASVRALKRQLGELEPNLFACKLFHAVRAIRTRSTVNCDARFAGLTSLTH